MIQIGASIHLNWLKVRRLTFLQFCVIFIPIIIGAALGFFAAREEWYFALALAALAPIVILFSQRPFIGVILWLVLMPLSSALPNQELIYWVIHRILITFTLCMVLLPRLAKSSHLPRLKLEPPEICIMLLAVYVPSSILLSSRDLYLPLKGFFELMLIPFFMYVIIRSSVLDHWKRQLIQWAALFIALTQCIIGLLSWFSPGIIPPIWLKYFQTRMCGSLLNPNLFGAMLLFCVIILFQSAMSRPRGLVRSGFLLTAGLCVICVFLTMERAVWLGMTIVVLGLVILYPKSMIRYLVISAVILGIIGGGLLSEKISQASARLNSQSQVNIRLALFDAMSAMIQDKPVFGWGYGTLNYYLRDYYNPYVYAIANDRFETSHNTYLTILTELGLLGFLLYLLPIAWLISASLRAWRGPLKMQPERRMLLAVYWLAALQQFVISNFMDMRFFPVGLALWWMNLALIANLVYQHPEKHDRLISNGSAKTAH